MRRLHVWTIGCQMNDADAHQVQEALGALGYQAGAPADEADVVVLVTCVVRQAAEDKAVARIDSLKGHKERHPDSLVLVMGCLVGDAAALTQRYPWVDAFFPPSDIVGLAEFVRQHRPGEPNERPSVASTPVSVSVPISLGCDHHCTYCIVRLRRGSQQSRPAAAILADAVRAVGMGAREIVLLGQNVDAYGRDLPGQGVDLAGLLAMVNGIDGLIRLRFLTSHPAEMTLPLIKAVEELDHVCPHFELPVQSGDDTVLRRMGRGYTASQYSTLVYEIRAHVPGCSIATDVIVGFPGETEEQFDATCQLVTNLRFDTVHLARYSPRPGTPAASLPDDVPEPVKERRRLALDRLQARISLEINSTYLGRTVETLVERKHRGRWQGRSATNKLVFFDHDGDWTGKVAPVEIVWAGAWSIRGKLRV